MAISVSTQTFAFTDFGKDEVCLTTIEVVEKISNRSPVYVINYKHVIDGEHIDSVDGVRKPCPFAHFPKYIRDSYDGAIVIKNDITKNMVRLMMMSDRELENHSGTSTAQDYRSRIMINITQFWD